MLGEVVAELVNTILPSGYQEVNWNASDLSSGIYLYSIEASSIDNKQNFSSVKKMMLIK